MTTSHMRRFALPALRVEREIIDVTADGLFGGPRDVFRKFAPGLVHYFVNDQEVTEIEFFHARFYRGLMEATTH